LESVQEAIRSAYTQRGYKLMPNTYQQHQGFFFKPWRESCAGPAPLASQLLVAARSNASH
jgi:hypothetical protein